MSSVVLSPLSNHGHKRHANKPQFQIEKTSLQCSLECNKFQRLLKSQLHKVSQNENIDNMLEECNKIVKSSAAKSFDKPQSKPRQPWITPSTWSVLKYAAPLRRQ